MRKINFILLSRVRDKLCLLSRRPFHKKVFCCYPPVPAVCCRRRMSFFDCSVVVDVTPQPRPLAVVAVCVFCSCRSCYLPTPTASRRGLCPRPRSAPPSSLSVCLFEYECEYQGLLVSFEAVVVVTVVNESPIRSVGRTRQPLQCAFVAGNRPIPARFAFFLFCTFFCAFCCCLSRSCSWLLWLMMSPPRSFGRAHPPRPCAVVICPCPRPAPSPCTCSLACACAFVSA